MNLLRFFLGLTLLTMALVTYNLTTDPFAIANVEHGLVTAGKAVGGVTGALIWGVIIWAPIRFFRGTDKTPEIRSFTLYTAAVFVAIFIVFRLFTGTPLDKSDRITFISGIEKTCFSNQRTHQENSTFNDTQLHEYCACVASSLSTEVSEEELKYAANGAFPSSLRNKSNLASERCGQKLHNDRQGSRL